mmetsp:Transcript_29869/g.44042  ORF Transcript_29869/g.44042 Transcript_29869/m.44042 type:complete len:203 (+) Transcript_29869:709-1317(+)
MQTSSAFWPVTGCESSFHASTAIPNAGTCISPAKTGTVGAPHMKQPSRSVPPVIEARCTSRFTWAWTQAACSGRRGDPVDRSDRSAPRSAEAAGATPRFMHAWRNLGLVPRCVTPSRPARRHSAPRSGCPGAPSRVTRELPVPRPAAIQFHIIQPQVVKKNIRSPAARSQCRASSFFWLSSTPPARCTMHLGMPVVPEENMM